MTKIEELVQSIKQETDHYADQDFYSGDIKRILKEFAIEMCEKQKKIILDKIEIGKKGAFGIYWNHEDVVLNNLSVLESPLPEELR